MHDAQTPVYYFHKTSTSESLHWSTSIQHAVTYVLNNAWRTCDGHVKITSFLCMAYKWNSSESVPVLKLVPLHGKVLAEVGMQMADKFKNQCAVNRLFAKYMDTQPADAKYIHKSCLQCLTFEI